MKKLRVITSLVLTFALLLSFGSCKKEKSKPSAVESVSGTVAPAQTDKADESNSASSSDTVVFTNETSSVKLSQTAPSSKSSSTKPAEHKTTLASVPKTTSNPWLPHPNLLGDWAGKKEIPLKGSKSSFKLKFSIHISISKSATMESYYFCYYTSSLENYDESLEECKKIVAETNNYNEAELNMMAEEYLQKVLNSAKLYYAAEAFINSFVIQRITTEYEESYKVEGNKLTITKTTDPSAAALVPFTLTKV